VHNILVFIMVSIDLYEQEMTSVAVSCLLSLSRSLRSSNWMRMAHCSTVRHRLDLLTTCSGGSVIATR
jgi:hypothetical protein